MNVIISDELAGIIEERYLKNEDVESAVRFGESTGKKLYIEGEEHFLTRERIGNTSVYAEYTVSGDDAVVLDAYSHMAILDAEAE